MRKKTNKDLDISAGLIDVAFVYQLLGFHDDAIENLEESLKLAEKINEKTLITNCYQLLGVNYEKTGNIRKANDYYGKYESFIVFLEEESREKDIAEKEIQTEQIIRKTEQERQEISDSLRLAQLTAKSKEDSVRLVTMESELALAKKEEDLKRRRDQIKTLNQERELQQKEIETQKAKQRSQQLMLLSAAIGLIFMIVLAVVMIRANRNRKRANTKLSKQNKEIAEKSEQLSGALKKIAHQNQNITQSINYAKGIQKALLPVPEKLNDHLMDSFIFFNPRDIVSGDFYWFRELDAKSDIFKIFGMHRRNEENDQTEQNISKKKFIISAVDCTGHGVPGAFMSMIGYNLLDEITTKGITRPDLILEELHKGVKFTLKQEETNNQDGMDMAMCVVDFENKRLEFAGAKNPLVYIQNGEVKQIKGDKNGIGGKSDNSPFTLHTLDIDTPTYCYMFSDGFIDQFGGEKGHKYMIKHFRNKLLEIHKFPFPEQRTILKQELKDWIGTEYHQIDDVLVIGFKVDFSRPNSN
jgi:serine phosphatase RsbU (regulator of sigma subunit)